jgi:selenide, water dikinase
MAATSRPLTSFSPGAGCGCKLPAGTLLPLVRALGIAAHPAVLVGSHTGDDAAVIRLREDLALVQTVDFFTPLVDDPYDFGRIAAANAFSDVYAMGGEPLSALNLVAFPLEELGVELLGEILRGAADIAAHAGAAIVGGHSIEDPEPKFGLAVTGTVDPRAVLTNAGARAGDALVLTKPLGVGAIVAARKRGLLDERMLAQAVETMTALNAAAATAARSAGAHAMTDVTGFGLLGHLHNLARESGLAARVEAPAIPSLAGVLELLEQGDGISGGTRRNAEYAEAFTTFREDVPAAARWLACDATTSGGLLVALPPASAQSLPGAVIGVLGDGPAGSIEVV